jgi:2,3-bisphosphoglycerate-independent phosphoglycerate mutase
MQNLPRINQAIEDGSLASHSLIKQTIETLSNNKKTCHLVGLLSDGGVHAHQDHIVALVRLLTNNGISVKVHAILDGRDTPPQSAAKYVGVFNEAIAGLDASIVTVSGRYWAMDRDQRWERVEKYYNALVIAKGEQASSVEAVIDSAYAAEVTDEFVEATVIGNYAGVEEGDALIMANFRSDRVREILTALLDPSFDGFERQAVPNFSHAVGMVEYSSSLNNYIQTLFPPEKLSNILGEVVDNKGMRQLRIAETEKYAHVTFFFNGGKEEQYANEERILVPSPSVATYDMQPEMSAYEVTDKLVGAINSEAFEFIVVNYANTDMVGHTGKEEAAIKAVEAVDQCLQKVVDAVRAKDGVMLITADHGNAECMVDEKGRPHTSHTTGPVPCILVGGNVEKVEDGRLCDIAPTLLTLMGIEPPQEMTGKVLVA